MAIHINKFVVGKVVTSFEMNVCRYTLLTSAYNGVWSWKSDIFTQKLCVYGRPTKSVVSSD